MKTVKYCIISVVCVLLGMATLSSLFSVYCGVNPTITITADKDAGAIERWAESVNTEVSSYELTKAKKSDWTSNKIENFKIFECSTGDEIIRENDKSKTMHVATITMRKLSSKDNNGTLIAGYNDLDQKSREKVMGTAFTFLESANGISRTSKVKIYNFLYNSDEETSSVVRELSADTKADFYFGYSFLKKNKIFNLISKILGVLCLFIFGLLAITLTLDLAFITIPMVRVFCMDMQDKNNGKRGLIDRLFSYEAKDAIAKSESASNDSGNFSVVGYYLKNKTREMIVLFICMLYLVAGRLYSLLAVIMNLFNSFVN